MNSSILTLPNKKVAQVIAGGRGFKIADTLQGLDSTPLPFLRPAVNPQIEHKDTTNISILTTNTCNMACSYCYLNEDINSPQAKVLDIEMIKTGIMRLGCHDKLGINFIGGEPLLNMSLIVAVVEMCNKRFKAPRYSVVTNGSLLGNPAPDGEGTILDWLNRHKFTMSLSLEGPEHLQNRTRMLRNGQCTYEGILRSLRDGKASEAEIVKSMTYRVTTTFDDTTYFERIKFFNALISQGIGKTVRIELAIPAPIPITQAINGMIALEKQFVEVADWFIEQFREGARPRWPDVVEKVALRMMHKSTTQTSCGAGNGYMSISYDGEILACHRGNSCSVETNGKFDQKKIVGWRNNSSLRHESCANCSALQICGGGCRAISASNHSGDLIQPNAVECLYKQMKLKMGLYLISELGRTDFINAYK